MKKDLTEIICILDQSGSMQATQAEAIQGFNTFLKEQKELPGEARLTLRLFSSAGKDDVRFSGEDIQKIPELTNKNYKPDGLTALFDAIGESITVIGIRLNNTPEEDRPEKIIVVIMTDGQENNSQFYNVDQIKDMITHQSEKYSWQFVYLGANQDAFANGGAMGIPKTGIANYQATGDGTLRAYNSISSTVRDYRSSGKVDVQQT